MVSTISVADAPQRRRYVAKDDRAGCTGLGGTHPAGRERLTTPIGQAPPPPLTPSQGTAEAALDKKATQCGASLSGPALPEIRAKEACCQPATTSPRGGRLNLQDPCILGDGDGSPSLVKLAGTRGDATPLHQLGTAGALRVNKAEKAARTTK